MSSINQINKFAALEKINGLDGTKPADSHPNQERKQEASHDAVSAPSRRQKVSLPELERLVENLNEAVASNDQQLRFEIDKETGSHVIKVVDRNTLEVIRQLPNEELLNIKRALQESLEKNRPLKGVLLDARV